MHGDRSRELNGDGGPALGTILPKKGGADFRGNQWTPSETCFDRRAVVGNFDLNLVAALASSDEQFAVGGHLMERCADQALDQGLGPTAIGRNIHVTINVDFKIDRAVVFAKKRRNGLPQKVF